VYIDVHKAIRRLQPAPKARIPKTQIIEHRDSPLIDLRDDDIPSKQLERSTTSESRAHSPVVFSPLSPKTTFLRRASAGNEQPIRIRGNATDMREHLKHLGPSNLASRPKSTRYQNVKIKPGHVLTRTTSRTDSNSYIANEPPSNDLLGPAPGGGEGEGLLKSAGREASDGVHALQQGYGTLDALPPKRSEEPSSNFTNQSHTNLGQQTSISIIGHHTSSDSLGSKKSSTSSPTNSIRRKRRAARSGSITENVIDANGFQKVVLETNSSGDDDVKEDNMNGGKLENMEPKSFLNLLDSHSNLAPVDEDEPPASGSAEGGKKKRRRKRKNKQNGDG
jgi:metal transporter CNNM